MGSVLRDSAGQQASSSCLKRGCLPELAHGLPSLEFAVVSRASVAVAVLPSVVEALVVAGRVAEAVATVAVVVAVFLCSRLKVIV